MLHLNIYLKNYWEAQEDEFKYVNYDEHFSTDEPCNIYLVGIRPRVIIDPNYIVINEKSVELKFKIQQKHDFKEVLGLLPLHREVVGEIEIESDFPYSRFNLKDKNGYFFDKEHDRFVNNNQVRVKSLYALRYSSHNSDINFNDLELLYIGKSLKMDTKVSPVKRIKNHEKIKNILYNCTQKYLDKEVYVILCSYVKKIDLLATSEEFAIYHNSKENIMADLKKNIEDLNATKELTTQIAEAGLIDYFNTKEFNVDFIGTFGKNTHAYYPFVKKSKLSSIVIETDLTDLCKTYSKTTEAKYYHMVKYFPKHNYLKATEITPDEFSKY